jgi:uncharacterized membrane protein YqhA
MAKLIEKTRYLAFIGVLGLLVATVTAYGWGIVKTVDLVTLVVSTFGQDRAITIEMIEIVDVFLIATTLLIFSASLYELFIGEVTLPEWMLVHNLYELKAKLSSMIVLVMAVKFLQKLLEVKDYGELLQFALAITMVSAMLIAFGYFGKKD